MTQGTIVAQVIEFEEARKRLRPKAEELEPWYADAGVSHGCIEGNIISGERTFHNGLLTTKELEGMNHINDLIDLIFNNKTNKNNDRDKPNE